MARRAAAPGPDPAPGPGPGPADPDRFDGHPTVALVAQWRANLPTQTGRSLEDWGILIERDGPAGKAGRTTWLQREHGLPSRTAMFLADAAGELRDADPAAYQRSAAAWVAALFSGKRSGLRPLYDTLLAHARALGPDVRVGPCSTIVPLYRRHVFAQLKPSTNIRLDLGLAQGAPPCSGSLIDTGGLAKKDRISHRIAIEHLEQIDAEVSPWLRVAYNRDA